MTTLKILYNEKLMKKPPLKQASLDALQYINETSNSPTQTIHGLFKNVGSNYLKNTFAATAVPMAEKMLNMIKLSVEASLVVGTGTAAKFGYEAMSVGARVIAGKAMIGGAQGLGGSMVAGGDKYDHLWNTSVGAAIGIVTASEFTPIMKQFSSVSIGMASAATANIAAQRFTMARHPDSTSFSFTSLGISTWAGGIAGLLTRYGAAGISGGVLQSTAQIPADVVGAHIYKDVRNAYR
jgi:hypothetical protein